MSEKNKPFSDPRWNETSKPKIIGYREIPEEESKKYDKKFKDHLRKIGVLKDEQEEE